MTIGDAREMLLTTRDRYDVIASEPSNPFRAGIASLFTVEYYRAARRAPDRRRRVRAVGAGVRDRRADAADDLRDARRGVPAGRDVADEGGRSRARRVEARWRLSCGVAARAHRRGAVRKRAEERVAGGRPERPGRALYRDRPADARARVARAAPSSTPTTATSSSSGWRVRSAVRRRCSSRNCGRRRVRSAPHGRRSTATPACRGPRSTRRGRTSRAGTHRRR